ncbi:glycine--tRNA ligase [Patescibacteria group bacterium]
MTNQNNLMEDIISLAKRRGFIFQSSEMYGGLGGFYDYGPLGVELKRKVESQWWKIFVEEREDVVGLASSIIMNPKVWEASGHLEHFSDPLVECKKCHQRFRADQEAEIKEHQHQEFTEPRSFNTLFKTYVGPTEDDANVAYLRPETAQGMFVNFENVLNSTRATVPFGIAQIGKSFRNEITYRNFIFRVREFDIAEVEYFVKPGEDDQAFADWLKFMERALTEGFGLDKKKLKHFEHPKEKLAHYSKQTIDIMYQYPWGWDELWGLANRTDYDLKQHEKFSGQKLAYRDPKSGETYTPYVIEPTGGIDRLLLAILAESYSKVKGGRTTTTKATKDEEVVLKLPKNLAPFQVAVLPLTKKESVTKVARQIYDELRLKLAIDYDEVASVGRRYRRQDEIGTPYCVTIDFDSLDDKQVTIRDRDTMKQDRIPIDNLADELTRRLAD